MPEHYIANVADLTAVANAIRAKGGTTDALIFPDGFVSAIGNLGPGEPVQSKDVNFIDYDGTVLHSYTVAEAAALTALPALPTHDGLTCQGWNWSLADIKALGRAVTVGAMYITDDGKTRIYIHLEEGRTSPMLGCCPNGTVTVDWGDGTTPDTLTGTDTTVVQWTPTHNYAAAGDYVIKLSVNGEMGFYGGNYNNGNTGLLRHRAARDNRNVAYQGAIQKIEIGNGITAIGEYAFFGADFLFAVTIPENVTTIEKYALSGCEPLRCICIPKNVTLIGTGAFNNDKILSNVAMPNGVTAIEGYAFGTCYCLSRITIPNSVTSIGNYAFNNNKRLANIVIPSSVTEIGSSAFSSCYGMKFYDFSSATAVPTIASNDTFANFPSDCKIYVPTSLVAEWKGATNWTAYARYIVGVSA